MQRSPTSSRRCTSGATFPTGYVQAPEAEAVTTRKRDSMAVKLKSPAQIEAMKEADEHPIAHHSPRAAQGERHEERAHHRAEPHGAEVTMAVKLKSPAQIEAMKEAGRVSALALRRVGPKASATKNERITAPSPMGPK